MNRVGEFVANTPIITLSLLIINISIHIFVFIFSVDISPLTFNPYQVIYAGEYYRIFTSAFLHGGILHIAMNMMSLVTLGGLMEPTYGSIRFLWITWTSIILAAANYIFFAWLTGVIFQNPAYLFSNSIGYSGVLFAYTAIESFHASSPYRSIFGLFSVPTKLYPIILLVIIQFILPNISLFGHLGGLVAGLMLISSFGSSCLLPSLAAFEAIETSCCCALCRRQSAFRLLTNTDLVHPMLDFRCCSASNNGNSGNGGILSAMPNSSHFAPLMAVFVLVFTTIGQVLYTLCYITGFPIDSCIYYVHYAYAQTIGRFVTFVGNMFTTHNHNHNSTDSENPPSRYYHNAQQQHRASNNAAHTSVSGFANDNTNSSSSTAVRLNNLPATIATTPTAKPPASNSNHSVSHANTMNTTSISISSAIAQSVLPRSLQQQQQQQQRSGYEMVAQQAPDSHFTNSPLHTNNSLLSGLFTSNPTRSSDAAHNTTSSSGSGNGAGRRMVGPRDEEQGTMLEVDDDENEDEQRQQQHVQQQHVQQQQDTRKPSNNTTASAKTSNTSSSSNSNSGQYYHRSKQTSRLLNPELYNNNSTGNDNKK